MSRLVGVAALTLLLAACPAGVTNLPPTISVITNQNTTEGEPIEVPFTVTDENLAALFLMAASSNQTLVADADLTITGSGQDRTLAITPTTTGTGTVQITITAKDNTDQQATRSFALEITAQGNQPPVISQVAEQRTYVGEAINVQFIVTDEAPASLLLTAASSDQTLVTNANLTFSGSGQDRVLTITPSPAGFGTVQITITAKDDADQTASRSFALEVRDPFTYQYPKLTASDGAAGDSFGFSVGISGDYAIVGALLDDDQGTFSGSAYIFRRNGANWTEVAILAASDGAAGDQFGDSVAISGDHAIVGAHLDDDGGDASGSAYIFRRNGDTWAEVAKLTAMDGAEFDQFGWSVAINGDHAIVGALQDDDEGSNSGSAYIFRRSGNNWTEIAKLTALDGAANDRFGVSVAISGDYAIVGADLDDDKGGGSGSAYVFRRNGNNWTEIAKLTASDGAENDQFGTSVGIDGDHAVVGAIFDDDEGGNSGSAYVFGRSGDNWTEVARLTASDGAAVDQFGASVAISGDHTIVGAPLDDDKGGNSGSAYIFRSNGGNWTEIAKLTASDGAANFRFGTSVAISGDHAIAGAHEDAAQGSDPGSAYLFRR